MTTRTTLLLPLALTLLSPACAHDDGLALEDMGTDTGESGSDDTDGSEGQPDLPQAPELEILTLDRSTIEAIEGSWGGPVDPSPFGTIPFFPLNFDWDEDGSLHAHTDFPGMDGYFDFRFVEVADGHWQLTEEGKLPSGPTQTYTLDPVSQEGPKTRWVYLEDPEYLAVELTVTEDALVLDSWVRGDHHATFNLAR